MSWYLDSGCSRHMTGRRSTFQDLVLKPGGEVKFGGDQKGKIIGSGTISFGNSPSITNVLLIEGLTHNLFLIATTSSDILVVAVKLFRNNFMHLPANFVAAKNIYSCSDLRLQ